MKIVKRKRILSEILLLFLGSVVVFCAVLILVRGIYRWNRNQTHLNEMIILAEMTIPNLEYDLYCDVKVLKQDKYGRYLFRVDHLDAKQRGFIIVQKSADENGIFYYYPENSTLLVDDVFHLTDEEKELLEKLKEQNNWNQPLQEDKMVPISIE